MSPLTITLSFYAVGVISVGIIANRLNKSLNSFALGDRRLNSTLTAFGVGSSDMGGWLLLALPGAFFLNGFNQIWMPLGLILGAYLNWTLVASRLRLYSEAANNSLSLPAYLAYRFQDNSKSMRTLTSIIILIFFTFYTSAGFVSIAVTLAAMLSIDYNTALWLGGFVIIAYTCIGGFLAVNWIDTFQCILLFIVLLLLPIAATIALGGLDDVTNALQFIDKDYFSPTTGMSFIAIASLMGWGLGYFGQPHILSRFMAIYDAKGLPKARIICMIWLTIALFSAMSVGLVGAAYFPNKGLADHETIFLILANLIFNSWISALLFAAVLSAIMSTIAGQLLASATSLTNDLYYGLLRPRASSKELLLVSRFAVLVVSMVAIIIGINPDGTILKLVSFAWAGLGASFGPVILLSLFWMKMTKAGALAGLATGGLTVIAWSVLTPLGGIFALYEIIPGFILAIIAIVVVSVKTKAPSEQLQNQFKKLKPKSVL